MPAFCILTGPSSRYGGASSGGGGGGEDWQLAAGHYVAAKIPLEITQPVENATSEDWSIYSKWPSLTAWSAPIVVLGGAFPFKYEITDTGGLTGLTITETISAGWMPGDTPSYGIMSCASPAVGAYAITVLVTDQEGTTDTVTFTLNVIDRENTANFVWIDASAGNDSNTGSYSSPKATHVGWYGTSSGDATHVGKQAHFRAGTYAANGGVTLGGADLQLIRCNANKPRVFCAVEGETVIFDGNDTAYFYIEGSACADSCFKGIEWRHPQVNEGGSTRAQYIRVQSGFGENRFLAFRNKFTGDGTNVGGSNSSCIMLAEISGVSVGAAFIQNEWASTQNMDFVLTYTASKLVFEGNISTGTCEGGQGLFVKGEIHSNITCRGNKHVDTHLGPLFFYSHFTAGLKEDIEFCWNNARVVGLGDNYGAVCVGQGSGAASPIFYGDFWSYRNNVSHDGWQLTGLNGGPFNWEYDCFEVDTANVAANGVIYSSDQGATYNFANMAVATSLFDSNNKLTGASRTSYLGTHGCEVA